MLLWLFDIVCIWKYRWLWNVYVYIHMLCVYKQTIMFTVYSTNLYIFGINVSRKGNISWDVHPVYDQHVHYKTGEG